MVVACSALPLCTVRPAPLVAAVSIVVLPAIRVHPPQHLLSCPLLQAVRSSHVLAAAQSSQGPSASTAAWRRARELRHWGPCLCPSIPPWRWSMKRNGRVRGSGATYHRVDSLEITPPTLLAAVAFALGMPSAFCKTFEAAHVRCRSLEWPLRLRGRRALSPHPEQ